MGLNKEQQEVAETLYRQWADQKQAARGGTKAHRVGMRAIVVFVLLFVLACELPEEAPASTSTPAPTSTPLPTATATSGSTKYVPSGPFAHRPTPTAKPRLIRRVGLGAGLTDFEKKFGGMTFEYARLADGTDRWMASQDHVVIEVIGPKASVHKATLAVAMDNVLVVTTLSVAFLEVAAPGWEEDGLDWMAANMERAVDEPVATSHQNKLIGMDVSPLGLLILTIEAR